MGNVTAIDVSGRITHGDGTTAIRDEMLNLTTNGTRKDLLNRREISYIDMYGPPRICKRKLLMAVWSAQMYSAFVGILRSLAMMDPARSLPH
jgi:hypothetical protein